MKKKPWYKKIWPKKKRPCCLVACWKCIREYFQKKKKSGFSLIEILVVTAIIGVVSTGSVVTYQTVQVRANDSSRKSDLNLIKTALEDYYNDNECYPSAEVFVSANCETDVLSPYLTTLPCDPKTKESYLYAPLDNACKGYALYASLQQDSDPDIANLNCDTEVGCGFSSAYNYGVSSGVPVYNPLANVAIPTPTPTTTATATPTTSPSTEPTPTPSTLYAYACDAAGNCNQYDITDPELISCPVTFEQSNCNNECGNEDLRCR